MRLPEMLASHRIHLERHEARPKSRLDVLDDHRSKRGGTHAFALLCNSALRISASSRALRPRGGSGVVVKVPKRASRSSLDMASISLSHAAHTLGSSPTAKNPHASS